jgi:purine-nucleoside phosphorylase
MHVFQEIYQKAADTIQKSIGKYANAAIIVGTGLGEYYKNMKPVSEISYDDIPGFPKSTVEGHAGKLKLMKIGNKSVIMLFGRFHYYEGYSMQEVSFPIRVLKLLGINHLILSNVAGSLNPTYNQGDLIFIRDHINLLPENPLRGKNLIEFGPRFPDMMECYSAQNRNLAKLICGRLKITYHEGIYLSVQGPSLETPAEYNMFHLLGADLIGMSTVPEVIVAHHAGMNILAASIVSNVCYPIEKIEKTSLESVLKVAKTGSEKLARFLNVYIGESNEIF